MRLRRARSILVYWRDETLFIDNYLTRNTVSADLKTLDILNFFHRWRKAGDLCSFLRQYSRASVAAAVAQLETCGLLLREGSAEARQDADLARVWSQWLPEGSFHFATKDANYISPATDLAGLKRSLPATPQPALFKTYRGKKRFSLPARRLPESEFLKVLMARRTHRKFRAGKVSLDQVARLLSLTWGVTGYVPTALFGPLPLKTSPSGGARHPCEVYLVAINVEGLAPGLYHYHPLRHRLEEIRKGPMRKQARRYCAGQEHPANAAALFIITAVFPRSMWKYHLGRAYRVVTLDAGHLGQTFCLVATWLGLAPFTTAALKDSLIEKDLEIDGIRESVIYLAGVGLPWDGKD